MKEREERRKAREREQQSSGASEKYTQVDQGRLGVYLICTIHYALK